MRHGITPGLTVWQTLGDGPVRGGCLHKERLIVVSGAIVYQLEKNGAVKSIGTLQSKEGRVKAISNGFQVLIVDVNGDGYRYDGTGVNRLTDPDFTRLKPTTATFHDGYGVVNRRDTGEYYISSSYDFTAWSSLDFATAEAKPDDIVEIVSDKNLLWFLGTRPLRGVRPPIVQQLPEKQRPSKQKRHPMRQIAIALYVPAHPFRWNTGHKHQR